MLLVTLSYAATAVEIEPLHVQIRAEALCLNRSIVCYSLRLNSVQLEGGIMYTKHTR